MAIFVICIAGGISLATWGSGRRVGDDDAWHVHSNVSPSLLLQLIHPLSLLAGGSLRTTTGMDEEPHSGSTRHLD
jgi:hypothetical protein